VLFKLTKYNGIREYRVTALKEQCRLKLGNCSFSKDEINETYLKNKNEHMMRKCVFYIVENKT